jgi:hypothetical protein
LEQRLERLERLVTVLIEQGRDERMLQQHSEVHPTPAPQPEVNVHVKPKHRLENLATEAEIFADIDVREDQYSQIAEEAKRRAKLEAHVSDQEMAQLAQQAQRQAEQARQSMEHAIRMTARAAEHQKQLVRLSELDLLAQQRVLEAQLKEVKEQLRRLKSHSHGTESAPEEPVHRHEPGLDSDLDVSIEDIDPLVSEPRAVSRSSNRR